MNCCSVNHSGYKKTRSHLPQPGTESPSQSQRFSALSQAHASATKASATSSMR
ncbi:hypothetical protein E1A91_A08G185100v1 [Gossypium mustelinum]|uniref:Uncharacterized protein n=1 Tax=Gossypium mustelinum TaxID=34275 RepID=A0A5D2YAA7_GOSMU|nr:hypothetical protein E1A91_A08G185100v1 [Gossypium mustelinum]